MGGIHLLLIIDRRWFVYDYKFTNLSLNFNMLLHRLSLDIYK